MTTRIVLCKYCNEKVLTGKPHSCKGTQRQCDDEDYYSPGLSCEPILAMSLACAPVYDSGNNCDSSYDSGYDSCDSGSSYCE